MRTYRFIWFTVAFLASAAVEGQTQPWARTFSRDPVQEFVSIDTGPDGYVVAVTTGNSLGPCAAFFDRIGKPTGVHCTGAGGMAEIAAASDGGAYLIFRDFVEGRIQLRVLRLRKDGTLSWARNYDLPFHTSRAIGVADGGVVMAGNLNLAEKSGFLQSGIAKVSPAGDLEWMTIIDFSGAESIADVERTTDGYVVAGRSDAGAYVMAFDERGQRRWQRVIRDQTVPDALTVLPAGHIVVTGLKWSGVENSFWVGTLDRTGRVLSERLARPPRRGESMRVVSSRDGGFTMVGVDFDDETRTREYHIWSARADGSIASYRTYWIPYRLSAVGAGFDTGAILAIFAETLTLASVGPSAALSSCFDVMSERSTRLEKAAITPISAIVQVNRAPAASTTRWDLPATKPFALQERPCAIPKTVPWASSPAVAAPAALIERDRAVDAENNAIMARAAAFLVQGKFGELERTAEEYRRSRRLTGSGTPALALFYDGLTVSRPEFGSEQQHVALLERWRTSEPRSAAAANATALAYFNYAWDARGGGFANTVTESGAKRYEELKAIAARIVRDSAAFAAHDPDYHTTRVKLASADSCATFKELAYDRPIGAMAYPQFFRATAFYFLPRWCGTPDEYVAFAEYAAEATRERLGDAMYGLLAWDAAAREPDVPFLATFRFDWARVVRAFRDYHARFPDWLFGYHRLASLAYMAGDRATARQLFAMPQLAWSEAAKLVWDRTRYDAVRKWAAEEPLEKFMTAPPKPGPAPAGPSGWIAQTGFAWPTMLLRNRITLRDGVAPPSNSFFVQTPTGPKVVSSLGHFDRRGGFYPYELEGLPVTALRARLVRWDAEVASEGRRTIQLTPNLMKVPVQGHLKRGLVLTPHQPVPPGLHVLKPVADDPSLTDTGGGVTTYVVGCRPGVQPCQQAVYEANWFGEGVAFSDAVDPTHFYGSPVVSERGEVVAVVSGTYRGTAVPKWSENFGAFAATETIGEVLSRVETETAAGGSTFIGRPVHEWPPVLLLSEVTLRNGTTVRGINAFVVRTASGTVAISTARPVHDHIRPANAPSYMPVMSKDFLPAVESWKLTVPGAQNGSVTATPLQSAASLSEAVVLRLPAGKPLGVEILTIRTDIPARGRVGRGEPVTILGCRESPSGCTPVLYSGFISSLGETKEASVGRSYIELDQEVDPGDVAGGPVLDARGLVLGVSLGGNRDLPGLPQRKNRVQAELVVDVLKQAGVQ
jgi:hypothetical protein